MNNLARRATAEAIRRQAFDLQGPGGLDQLYSDLARKTAPKEKPLAFSGGSNIGELGSSGGSERSDTAVDHERDVLGRLDDLLGVADNALRRIAALINREALRITLDADPPVQPSLRGCDSCARLTNHKGEPLFVPRDEKHYGPLCGHCGKWNASYSEWPPIGLCEVWQVRNKVSNKDVKNAFSAAGQPIPAKVAKDYNIVLKVSV